MTLRWIPASFALLSVAISVLAALAAALFATAARDLRDETHRITNRARHREESSVARIEAQR